MMKKNLYNSPECILIGLHTEDVLTASYGYSAEGGGDEIEIRKI